MKRLIVLRHAKSSWSSDTESDHDRPLNGRGRRAAPLVGQALKDRGWVPDLVFCSDARRAHETYEAMAGCFPDAELSLSPDLYGAGLDEVQALAAGLPQDAVTVMVVGHNPGWEEMVSDLCGVPVRMSTGNAALLRTHAATFAEALATPASFELVELVRPRELEAAP